MAAVLQTLIPLLIAFSSFPLPTLSKPNLSWWCNQTPYPQICKHFFFDNPTKFRIPNQKSEFRKMVIQLALDRAIQATIDAHSISAKTHNGREMAAWADCIKLYQSTVDQLNRTLDTRSHCTQFDIQTWVSTALTNLDTCRTGFADIEVPDGLVRMSTNMSELICNSLALGSDNEAGHESSRYYDAGFPAWLRSGDRRRLLQAVRADAVVAQDGSGDFRRIKDALTAAASRGGGGRRRFVIHVKRGVYRENLEIKLRNVMLVGDGMRHTIITGSRSVGGGSTTFNSATVAVTGDGFIARGITFRNIAGPANYQAVALRSGADLSVFYRCGFEGYQDTLYVHSQRQFYKECYIYGTVDFIFGNAAVVLQNCMIYARRPLAGQKIAVTAQGRIDPNQNTGISVHNSRFMPAAELRPVAGSVRAFLGRPWKAYSRTVFMQTYLDGIVDPAGWLAWSGEFALDTLYYGEYRNMGPGSGTGRRVQWRGYRVITSPAVAERFTVERFIVGRSWVAAAGVPFTAGL